MARIRKKVAFALVFIAFVLAIVVFISLNPQATLPNPNGYDDFVKAGQMVTTALDGPRYLSDYPELTLEDLRAFAATNTDALKIARDALERQCRVPVKSSQEWLRNRSGEMIIFKNLTKVFLLAGRLAELEARTNDAANIYLDSIRFAHESTRGGMIADNATAGIQEALGMVGLNRVQDSLNAAQNRSITKVLEALNTSRESWGDYIRRDVYFALQTDFKSLFSLESWRALPDFKARFYKAERERRQAMLDFAARAYELETGEKPKSATNLVPAYLKTIPRDPLTRTNLVL